MTHSLIKGRHSVDVSRPLSGNQQPLQILRIRRGLTAYFIGHDDTPLTVIQSSWNLVSQLSCLDGPPSNVMAF